MKKHFARMSLVCLMLSQTLAHAAFTSESENLQLVAPNAVTSVAQDDAGLTQVGATYQMNKEVTVTPLGFERDEGSVPNTTQKQITLYETDSFLLMDRTTNAQGQVILRIGTQFEEAPDFYMLESDLPAQSASLYNESEDPETQSLANDEEAPDHSSLNFLKTEEARRHGGGHMRRSAHGGGSYCARHPYSKGCCYAGVKYRLMAMGLEHRMIGGVDARTAAANLGSGWHEVGCGSRDNPVRGETCTYVGGPHGHAELYDTACHGWWYGGSGGCHHYMQSPHRRCISCKAKG